MRPRTSRIRRRLWRTTGILTLVQLLIGSTIVGVGAIVGPHHSMTVRSRHYADRGSRPDGHVFIL